jgi:hypothetical protein
VQDPSHVKLGVSNPALVNKMYFLVWVARRQGENSDPPISRRANLAYSPGDPDRPFGKKRHGFPRQLAAVRSRKKHCGEGRDH